MKHRIQIILTALTVCWVAVPSFASDQTCLRGAFFDYNHEVSYGSICFSPAVPKNLGDRAEVTIINLQKVIESKYTTRLVNLHLDFYSGNLCKALYESYNYSLSGSGYDSQYKKFIVGYISPRQFENRCRDVQIYNLGLDITNELE